MDRWNDFLHNGTCVNALEPIKLVVIVVEIVKDCLAKRFLSLFEIIVYDLIRFLEKFIL